MSENEQTKAVFQIGCPELVPYCSTSVGDNLYKLSFNRQKQIAMAMAENIGNAQKRLLRKFKKSKILEDFSVTSAKITKNTVYLVTGNKVFDAERQHVLVYGQCHGSQFNLDSDLLYLRVPIPLNIGRNYKTVCQISVCQSHRMALTSDQELYIWGRFPQINGISEPTVFDNKYGRQYTCLSAAQNVIYFVHQNGLYVHGKQNSGRLGLALEQLKHTTHPAHIFTPKTLTFIKGISCSDSFAMCWDSRGTLYSWGNAQFGRLGHGCRGGTFKYHVYQPKKVQCLNEEQVVQAVCGSNHGLALTKKGDVYCWGQQYGPQIDYSKRPNKVKIPSKVKKIEASKQLSVALTCSGQLWTWGTSTIKGIASSPSAVHLNLSLPKVDDLAISCSVALLICGIDEHQQLKKSLSQSRPYYSQQVSMNNSFIATPDDFAIVFSTSKYLNLIENTHNDWKPNLQEQWKRFTRIKPKRDPELVFSQKSLRNSIVEYVDKQQLKIAQYNAAVDRFLSRDNKRKKSSKISEKPISYNLQKIRVQNMRKPRVILKTQGPTLLQLPIQLFKLLNRQSLCYLFLFIGTTVTKQKKHRKIQIIERYLTALSCVSKYERKPRHVMCPDFAQCIEQAVIRRKIRLILNEKIKKGTRKVNKIKYIFRRYHLFCKNIKKHLSFLFDCALMSYFKLSKGSSLQRLQNIVRNELDNHRKIKFTEGYTLLKQPFWQDTQKRPTMLNELPLLPYSKHQYELLIPEQSKFGVYNKQTRCSSQIRTRIKLLEIMLKVNLKNYKLLLSEYHSRKLSFFHTYDETIQKQRARILLLGMLPKNSDGEFASIDEIRYDLASKISQFPERPDMPIMLMLGICDKQDSQRNNFRKIFKKYTQIFREQLSQQQ